MTEYKITDGRYRVRNVATGLLLEVPGGSRRSGVKVLLAPRTARTPSSGG